MEIPSTIITIVGRNESIECGYCESTERSLMKENVFTSKVRDEEGKNEKKPVSFGVTAHSIDIDIFNRFLDIGWRFWAHRITVDDYFSLMIKGWRRSGRFLYKPIMEETCCPQYTIRLDVHQFRLSRTQKRVLRTMLYYLKYDIIPSGKIASVGNEDSTMHQQSSGKKAKKCSEAIDDDVKRSKVQNITQNRPKTLNKKFLRRKRAEERLVSKGIDLQEPYLVGQEVVNLIHACCGDSLHYKINRMEKEKARRRTLKSYIEYPFDETWKHVLKVKLVSIVSEEFKNTFRESYELYKKYQKLVHNDEGVSESQYGKFLESAPFSCDSSSLDDANFCGAYHEQFILDGKIIAIGVLDVLPRCVSSKYFFYDPDYRFLSMGTYSALREIYLTESYARKKPELHYYYMGFYVYNCPKMRYKGKFRPSELLCDKSYQWFPLSECDKMIAINNGKFTSFCDGKTVENASQSPESFAIDVENSKKIMCNINNNTVMPFGELTKLYHLPKNMSENLQHLAHYIGDLVEKVLVLYGTVDKD